MKSVYIISGTMGVGKTATSKKLMELLPDSVFLDGDWCWNASPFQVTDETKAMVIDNITHLLNNFIHCSAYKNVIFCWVMHQQQITDDILMRLDTDRCEVKCISLVADEEALIRRLKADIAAGIRTEDVISRSIERIPLYEKLSTIKIDVSHITPDQAAEAIAAL